MHRASLGNLICANRPAHASNIHEVRADRESTVKGQDDELKLELEYGKALVKACLFSLLMLFCWAQEASAVRVLSMMAAGGLDLPAVM